MEAPIYGIAGGFKYKNKFQLKSQAQYLVERIFALKVKVIIV